MLLWNAGWGAVFSLLISIGSAVLATILLRIYFFELRVWSYPVTNYTAKCDSRVKQGEGVCVSTYA